MHPIYRITSLKALPDYRLEVGFDDGFRREINLEPVLEGALYGPLRDRALFSQAEIDPEVHTVVWPNGADFDPATLHDWPEHEPAMIALARKWSLARA